MVILPPFLSHEGSSCPVLLLPCVEPSLRVAANAASIASAQALTCPVASSIQRSFKSQPHHREFDLVGVLLSHGHDSR